MRKVLLLLLPLFLITACGDNEKAPLDIPVAYDGANFDANAATELGVISRFRKMVSEAQKGRSGAPVSLDSLNYWYTTGSPSVQSLVSSYFAPKVTVWNAELAKASGNAYTPGTPAGDGGAFGGYLFDENGLELEQLLDKGLYGALLYNHFDHLTHSTITPATVDRMLAIFGANPSFPNSYQAALHARPDILSANYTARRDKNDGKGPYTAIRDAFIQLQAAVRAGDDYNEERDEAIETIRINWEKGNAATMINYLHAVISKLSATNPSDADKASALHSYGETVGFIQGWRTLPNKKITDQQIDEILQLLNAPENGTPVSYRFATDPLNELPKLTQVIGKLKAIYAFSDQDIEDFKRNWVVDQNR
jgi:hypothetical protein